ncbi:MAG: ATP-binding protein [Candidatus Bathyarchaeota archaeon]|nr:ATP-binding protein [Candidatus Bathyarchaeota archaeon]
MSAVNRIIFECTDTALSSFEFADKTTFYEYLKRKYSFNFEEFAIRFDTVHEALRDVYGANHYKIERMIIRTLNSQSRKGTYEHSDEVAAFGYLVNIFMAEAEKNLERQRKREETATYAKHLEERIKAADERLKDSERLAAIGQTAAMVGHDIRNPLQAIVGELYLEREEIAMLPEGDSKKNLLESLRSVEENIFYINKIVADLQDFAKPINGVKKENVDVNQVISEVMTIVPIPENLFVEIMVEKEALIIEANFEMLKRALSNLIMNAVQAMSNGGKLTIRAHADSDFAEIDVEDTGGGISDEVKDKLFKPLFTTKAKGQGLGLAAVKRLVEAQSGKIGFESQNGKGSRFFIQLPARTFKAQS